MNIPVHLGRAMINDVQLGSVCMTMHTVRPEQQIVCIGRIRSGPEPNIDG